MKKALLTMMVLLCMTGCVACSEEKNEKKEKEPIPPKITAGEIPMHFCRNR